MIFFFDFPAMKTKMGQQRNRNPKNNAMTNTAPLQIVHLKATTKKGALAEAVDRFGFTSAVRGGRGDSYDFFLNDDNGTTAELYVRTAADVKAGRAKEKGASLAFRSISKLTQI